MAWILLLAHGGGGGGKPPPAWALFFACLTFLVGAIPIVAAMRPRWRAKLRWGRGGKGPRMSNVGIASWFLWGCIWGTLQLPDNILAWPILTEHSTLLYISGILFVLVGSIIDGYRSSDKQRQPPATHN